MPIVILELMRHNVLQNISFDADLLCTLVAVKDMLQTTFRCHMNYFEYRDEEGDFIAVHTDDDYVEMISWYVENNNNEVEKSPLVLRLCGERPSHVGLNVMGLKMELPSTTGSDYEFGSDISGDRGADAYLLSDLSSPNRYSPSLSKLDLETEEERLDLGRKRTSRTISLVFSDSSSSYGIPHSQQVQQTHQHSPQRSVSDVVDGPTSLGGMMEIGPQDLRRECVLGYGNGGTVYLSMHLPTNTLLAEKVIAIDLAPAAQKQILTELQVLFTCQSPYIVSSYAASFHNHCITVLMEHLDLGSLDDFVRRLSDSRTGLPEAMLGVVVVSVIKGLVYLYQSLKVMHRDVKPSNILLNSAGRIKLCDFGVSGELTDSISRTFTGTNAYMAPERVQGSAYSVRSDVWSLGVSLIELATGHFPYAIRNGTGVAFELLEMIVNGPVPVLSCEQFSLELCSFVALCLEKDHLKRPTPMQLLSHPFVLLYDRGGDEHVDLVKLFGNNFGTNTSA